MDTSPALQTGITRDIYGMPAFATLIVDDVRATAAWFTTALDFIELFAMPPGDDPALIHLRRWRYQDLLVRRGEDAAAVSGGIQLSFAADYDELEGLAAKAREQRADVEGPADTPWNTRDVTVVTPQGLSVVFTARRPEPLRDAAFTADMERWNAEHEAGR